jgi:glyoxylase-like metal-dependent hydrolase (beta-lactamase superfamily II)/rhodanese-related sulfurtransferase
MDTQLTPAELKRRLDRGEPLFLLDVRPAKEFARWRIEASPSLAALNVPYTRIVAEAEDDDLARAAASYAKAHLERELPRDRLVVAVCAKGHTSAFVAEGLRARGYSAASLTGGMAAWASLYDVRAVADERDLGILQVIRPARGCLGYVVSSKGEAIVIDPLRHVERYLEIAAERKLRIVRVLDTHAHADHVSGGRELARRAGVRYGFHPYDAIHPIDGLPATFEFEPLWEGWTCTLGAVEIRALHVPGHTLGNLAFLVDGRFLLCGDSIFLQSIARPDLGGKAEAWTPLHRRSLQRLLALPDETIVLPGHFGTPAEADARGVFAASLGALRQSNDGLRRAAEDEGAFARYILSSLPVFPPEYVEIKRVNAGLVDPPTEERASELELGKNVCALESSGAART